MKNRLTGTGVALVTPFLDNGEIDFDALSGLVENVIQNGVDYLVTLCTTSETPTLTPEEREAIVRTVVAVNHGRLPVVRGLGGPSTHEIVHDLHTLNFTGIDALLSVTPYYNRPSQEGVYQHYKKIAEESPLPVILYNVPSRTGCNIDSSTTIRLANDCSNIIAIKEASGMMNQIMRVINHQPGDFSVISGDDALTLPLIATGAIGVISVVANAFPKEVSTMVRLALSGDITAARKIHLSLLDITQACFKEGNPSGIKALLSLQGKIKNILRLPQVSVSKELMEQMENLI